MTPKIRELIVQYRPHPAGIDQDVTKVTTAHAVGMLTALLGAEPYETFVALHLDAKCRLIAVQTVGRGDCTNVIVSARAIIAAAIGDKNSTMVILAHNHPSGDPTPSTEDVIMTRRIVEAARIFDVTIVDHIIIGNGTYCSFAESGRMDHL